MFSTSELLLSGFLNRNSSQFNVFSITFTFSMLLLYSQYVDVKNTLYYFYRNS